MVFVKRDPKPSPGFDVVTMMDNKSQSGEVGIEVEVEGNKFPKHQQSGVQHAKDPERIPPEWKSLKDGSLRGADNQEYVLKAPLPFDAIPGAVNNLFKMFTDYGTVLDDSNRTSVHVHVNVQSWHMNRLTTFMAMYYILEEILTEWCGDHRVGNLFCLRAKDAPALIRHVREFVRSDGRSGFSSNIHHYAALNTHALNKYGSLEFRTLRGVLEPTPIIEWVSIIRRLYDLSSNYPDPRELVETFSGEGPFGFLDSVLGDKAYVIRQGISMTDYQIRESLYDGIRMAQDICYCRDWSLFAPLKLDEDPFGRSRQVLVKRIKQQLDIDVAPASSSITTLSQDTEVYANEEDFEPETDYDFEG